MRGHQLLTSQRAHRRQHDSTTIRSIRLANVVFLILLVALITLWVRLHFAPYALATYLFGGAISVLALWELVVSLARWGIGESGANLRGWLNARWLLVTLALLTGASAILFCLTRSLWVEVPTASTDRVTVTLYDDTSPPHALARYTLESRTPRRGKTFFSTRRTYVITVEATNGPATGHVTVPLSFGTAKTILTTALQFTEPPVVCVMPGLLLYDRLPHASERAGVTFELQLDASATSLVHVMHFGWVCIGKAPSRPNILAAKQALLAHLTMAGVPADAQEPYLRLFDVLPTHVQADLAGGSVARLRVIARDSAGRATSVLSKQIRIPRAGTSYEAL